MTLYTYTQWQRRSQTLARRVCVRWCGNVQNHQTLSLAVSGEGHSRSVAANECVCHARAPRYRFAVMNGQPRKRTQLRTRTERNAQARAPRTRGADPRLRGAYGTLRFWLEASRNGCACEHVRMWGSAVTCQVLCLGCTHAVREDVTPDHCRRYLASAMKL